ETLSIPIQPLQQIASAAAENEDRSAIGVELQYALHLCAEGIKPAPHIGHAAGQIHAGSRWGSNHFALSAARTEHRVRSSTSPPTRPTMPFGHTTSMSPHYRLTAGIVFSPALSLASSIAGSVLASAFATTRTGMKPPSKPASACLRHVYRRPVLISYRRATSVTTASGASDSRTMRSFSSRPHRRRRSTPTRMSTSSLTQRFWERSGALSSMMSSARTAPRYHHPLPRDRQILAGAGLRLPSEPTSRPPPANPVPTQTIP